MARLRPAVRERMIQQQATYCTDEWLNDLGIYGFRFVWPFQAEAAYIWDESKHMLQASPEFFLRVRSLRSFTMAKDFIDRYPDLRGEVPQLEPSATAYQPSLTDTLEWSYWVALRRKLSDRKRRPLRRRSRWNCPSMGAEVELLPQAGAPESTTVWDCWS